MTIIKKLMGAAAASLLLAAIPALSANASVLPATTYPFNGLCDDCTSGVPGWLDGQTVPVSGELELHGYTPGTPLALSHFHSFTYNGSSIIPTPFTIFAAHATSLSGVLDAAGHVTSDFTLEWLTAAPGSPPCFGGTCTLFVPAEATMGFWSIGPFLSLDTIGEFDIGIMGTFAAVPEPGTLTILGLGLAGLGLARRRRAA